MNPIYIWWGGQPYLSSAQEAAGLQAPVPQSGPWSRRRLPREWPEAALEEPQHLHKRVRGARVQHCPVNSNGRLARQPRQRLRHRSTASRHAPFRSFRF